jgi:hypothetical protein
LDYLRGLIKVEKNADNLKKLKEALKNEMVKKAVIDWHKRWAEIYAEKSAELRKIQEETQ